MRTELDELATWAKQQGNKPALRFEGEADVSYAELDARGNSAAQLMARMPSS